MSATGLEVFDKTIHTTNTWLSDIMKTVGPDRQVAWHVLGAVLRAVRDRIPLGLAAHLGAQLPLLVRGTYYDQWRPSEQPEKWRSADEFFAIVSDELRHVRPVNARDAACAVFQVLNHYVEPNQVAKVREALPDEVRRLWPLNAAEADRGVGSAA
jgi:uncharacterized protein (DUF2267 family)